MGMRQPRQAGEEIARHRERPAVIKIDMAALGKAHEPLWRPNQIVETFPDRNRNDVVARAVSAPSMTRTSDSFDRNGRRPG